MLDLTLFKNWDTPAATPEALEKRPEKQDRPAAPRLRKAKTPLRTRPVLKVLAKAEQEDTSKWQKPVLFSESDIRSLDRYAGYDRSQPRPFVLLNRLARLTHAAQKKLMDPKQIHWYMADELWTSKDNTELAMRNTNLVFLKRCGLIQQFGHAEQLKEPAYCLTSDGKQKLVEGISIRVALQVDEMRSNEAHCEAICHLVSAEETDEWTGELQDRIYASERKGLPECLGVQKIISKDQLTEGVIESAVRKLSENNRISGNLWGGLIS